MKVEVYRTDEVACEPVEELPETKELIAELGLDGQAALISPESLERFSWRALRKHEAFVLTELCPARTAIEAYGADTIPLRVLRLVKEIREDFVKLEVWHPESAEKDPFLIGYRSKEWNAQAFLIARWGEELDAWGTMEEKALVRWRERRKALLVKISSEVKAALESVDLIGSVVAASQMQSSPSFYQ